MSEQSTKETEQQPGTTEAEGSSTASQSRSASRRRTLAKATQIIWLLTGILEILIGIRFVLKLLGANPQAGFAQLIYGMTAVFLVPFNALFASPSAAGSVLEVSSLVAMLVYALGAWIVVRVMWVVLEEEPRHGGGPGSPS